MKQQILFKDKRRIHDTFAPNSTCRPNSTALCTGEKCNPPWAAGCMTFFELVKEGPVHQQVT